MVFCMETEHPRRGRLASTGVWLLGSAASSETPLDSEMPPPSSMPSREVRRDGAKALTTWVTCGSEQ